MKNYNPFYKATSVVRETLDKFTWKIIWEAITHYFGSILKEGEDFNLHTTKLIRDGDKFYFWMPVKCTETSFEVSLTWEYLDKVFIYPYEWGRMQETLWDTLFAQRDKHSMLQRRAKAYMAEYEGDFKPMIKSKNGEMSLNVGFLNKDQHFVSIGLRRRKYFATKEEALWEVNYLHNVENLEGHIDEYFDCSEFRGYLSV